MKKQIVILLLSIIPMLSSARDGEPISLAQYADTTQQVNLHMNDSYSKTRSRGAVMMIAGAALTVIGVGIYTYSDEQGWLDSERNYPYNHYIAAGSNGLAATGLILFIGGLNQVVKIKF